MMQQRKTEDDELRHTITMSVCFKLQIYGQSASRLEPHMDIQLEDRFSGSY